VRVSGGLGTGHLQGQFGGQLHAEKRPTHCPTIDASRVRVHADSKLCEVPGVPGLRDSHADRPSGLPWCRRCSRSILTHIPIDPLLGVIPSDSSVAREPLRRGPRARRCHVTQEGPDGLRLITVLSRCLVLPRVTTCCHDRRSTTCVGGFNRSTQHRFVEARLTARREPLPGFSSRASFVACC